MFIVNTWISVPEGKPKGTVYKECSMSPLWMCHVSFSWQIFSRVTCMRGGNIWELVQCLTPQAEVSESTTRSHRSCLSLAATFLASRGPLGALSLLEIRPHAWATVQSNPASHPRQISSDTKSWSWKVTKCFLYFCELILNICSW
jgi:hypothetical protein